MTQKNKEQLIRETAYYMWLDAGSPMGQPDAFWYQAVVKVDGKPKKNIKALKQGRSRSR
jgi:hypothetical protein